MKPADQPAIGFIGTGVMGSPMASHLHRAGYKVTVYDLDMGVANALAKSLGGDACAAATPRAVAEASDIVITMPPNGEVVRDVTFGDQGLAAGLRKGS